MKKYIKFLLLICFLFSNKIIFAEPDTLTQVSTIDALLNGVYDGTISLTDIKKYGNFGIGTYHGLDGEMIVLNGKFYQIKADGIANIPNDEIKTPFVSLVFFEADHTLTVGPFADFKTFEKMVDKIVPTKNIFYAIKLKGLFQYIKYRSVPKQQKPYKPLKEVVANQPVYERKDVQGILVGFRCPSYVKGINVPGYHLHFLNSSHNAGGHVLELAIQEAELMIDEVSNFNLILPDNEDFYQTDLTKDQLETMNTVEK